MKRLVISLALVFPLSVSAAELPTRKAGMWEIETSIGGMKQSMKQCTDAVSDKAMMGTKDLGSKMGGKCSKNEINKVEGKYVAEAECEMNGMKVSSKTIFSGDFQNQYTATTDTKFTPPMPGAPEMKGSILAKWVGPCSEDMKPGDVVMSNGMRMNMIEGMKSMKGLPKNLKMPASAKPKAMPMVPTEGAK